MVYGSCFMINDRKKSVIFQVTRFDVEPADAFFLFKLKKLNSSEHQKLPLPTSIWALPTMVSTSIKILEVSGENKNNAESYYLMQFLHIYTENKVYWEKLVPSSYPARNLHLLTLGESLVVTILTKPILVYHFFPKTRHFWKTNESRWVLLAFRDHSEVIYDFCGPVRQNCLLF